MRSILLYITSAAFFAGAFFVPDADAAPRDSRSIVSGGQAGYCAVLSNSTIFASGSIIFSGETGFSQCASTAAGICGLKSDGSAKCTNGSTYVGPYVKIFSSSIGLSAIGQYGHGYLVFLKTDGTYENFEIGGNWVNLPSQSGIVGGSSQGGSATTGNYQIMKTDGSCFNANFGGSTLSQSLPAGQCVSVGTHYLIGTTQNNIFLKTDGTVQRTTRFADSISVSFSGTYREISSIDMQSATIGTCAIRESDGFPICAGNVGAWITNNAPKYAVRDIAVYTGPTQGVVAVRVSDNSLIGWTNASAATVLTEGASGQFVPEVITYSKNGMVCVKAQVPKLDTVSWINPSFMFSTGSVSTTVFTGASTFGCQGTIGDRCGDKIRTENADVDYLNVDRLTTWNFDVSTTIRTPSWRDPSIATGPRSTMIPDDYEPQVVGLGSIRNGERYAADVWEFSSVANPSTVEPWAYHTYADGTLLPIYASGGTATAVLANSQTSFTLILTEFSVPPIGFRMGKSTERQTAEYCRVGNNACVWDIVGSAYSCRAATWNNYYGNCAIDAFGRCAPVVLEDGTTSEGTPLEDSNVLRDAAGNVVAVTSADSAIRGTSISVDNVFACEYDGFLDIFPCAVTIVKNVWQLTTDSVNVAMGGGEKVNNAVQSVGSGGTATGSIDLSAVSGSGVNVADDIFRGAWNQGFAGNTVFSAIAKFALIGSLFLMILAIVLAIAVANRKQ